jgi:hypothetical protein
MKRYALVLATLVALLVTGVTLHAAGRFGPRHAHLRGKHSAGRQAALSPNESNLAIPTYYRQSGPRHWRDCLGQN